VIERPSARGMSLDIAPAPMLRNESLVDMIAASSAARINPAKMLGVYSRTNNGSDLFGKPDR
jgi:hypothetical protein